MNKKKIFAIAIIITIILIIAILSVAFLDRKNIDTKEDEIIINDINDISNTKKLDIDVSYYKDELGYNVTVYIKNSSENDIDIGTMKLSLKNKNNKEIANLYDIVDHTLKAHEETSSILMTDKNLDGTEVIDYELLD